MNNNKKELRRIQVHQSLKHSLHWGGNSFYLVSTSWVKNCQIFGRCGRKYWNKMRIDGGWDILLPSVYISVIYLSFISFFPSSFYCSFIFFSIKAILSIHMSPLCCSSLVSGVLLLVHLHWLAISVLLYSPSNQIIRLYWTTLLSAHWKGSLHGAARRRLRSWIWTFGRSQHKPPETISCPYSH